MLETRMLFFELFAIFNLLLFNYVTASISKVFNYLFLSKVQLQLLLLKITPVRSAIKFFLE